MQPLFLPITAAFMIYKQVTIASTDKSLRELLIALLSEADYEGFEETNSELHAFITEEAFTEESLHDILQTFGLNYTVATIPKTNWNKDWESNFQPVIVSGFCTIRADFHEIVVHTPYEIIITPKMSFGTGHHATTQLMMRMMQEVSFRAKSVLDFGTGTGILAILAEKLGADQVLAIDNDEWSYENALENAGKNDCHRIHFALGSLESVHETFDVILANINRHILIQYMEKLYHVTCADGTVLMSGLLVEDKEVIVQAAEANGFNLKAYKDEQNWIALCFVKN